MGGMELCEITASQHSTVKQLAAAIKTEIGIPLHPKLLLNCSEPLHASESLMGLRVQEGMSIGVVIQPYLLFISGLPNVSKFEYDWLCGQLGGIRGLDGGAVGPFSPYVPFDDDLGVTDGFAIVSFMDEMSLEDAVGSVNGTTFWYDWQSYPITAVNMNSFDEIVETDQHAKQYAAKVDAWRNAVSEKLFPFTVGVAFGKERAPSQDLGKRIVESCDAKGPNDAGQLVHAAKASV